MFPNIIIIEICCYVFALRDWEDLSACGLMDNVAVYNTFPWTPSTEISAYNLVRASVINQSNSFNLIWFRAYLVSWSWRNIQQQSQTNRILTSTVGVSRTLFDSDDLLPLLTSDGSYRMGRNRCIIRLQWALMILPSAVLTPVLPLGTRSCSGQRICQWVASEDFVLKCLSLSLLGDGFPSTSGMGRRRRRNSNPVRSPLDSWRSALEWLASLSIPLQRRLSNVAIDPSRRPCILGERTVCLYRAWVLLSESFQHSFILTVV